MHKPFLPCSLCGFFEFYDAEDDDRPPLCHFAQDDDCPAYKQWLEDMDTWRELQQHIYDPPRFFDMR